MSDRRRPNRRTLRPTVLVYGAVWLVLLALSVWLLGWERARFFVAGAVAANGAGALLAFQVERRKWVEPIRTLAGQIDLLTRDASNRVAFESLPHTEPLVRSLARLVDAFATAADASAPRKLSDSGIGMGSGPKPAMSRSALMESGTGSDVLPVPFDPMASGDFSATGDMVNRLEPRLLRWLESSPAEQAFLGWNLRTLREKSLLEIVHPDDLVRVKEQLGAALVKGEVHGLIFRIRTAHGKPRWIEMNVGARYAADMTVNHLRCHITDVTSKIRAERELKLRTRELTQVNDQLRTINRELEDLKERYRDLYQNAPAMYFSLDEHGLFLECNDTLLHTLGFPRESLIGQSYEVLLPESRRPAFAERFREYLRGGTIEATTEWLNAAGEVMVVWVTGTAERDSDGKHLHSRSVAQDITARHRLEAELQEKNARLARTIEELSRRNKEMDEFTYVVSHDLQEPLRTLTAFSDFLLRDYGDRLDAEGQEFVRYIVDASRRMRALILDLLSLSRVGKVTADFTEVHLEEVIGLVRADLAELIRSKGAEFKVVGILPTVWGDQQRLGQLLANLVSNGLKYNDKRQPAVEVGATPSDAEGWVTIHVRDNGIGIEPQFHAKIFQLFRRLHTREEYEGTGAGLAICEKIAVAHGGRLRVESEPGRGSTFSVTLPVPRPRSEPQAEAAPTEMLHAT